MWHMYVFLVVQLPGYRFTKGLKDKIEKQTQLNPTER